jgi:hypothetical protein
MKTILAAIAAAPMLAQPVASTAEAAGTGIRTERVRFATGAASAVIKGRLQGDADVDYLVRAGAGQTLTVTLQETNPQNFFNINPPDTAVAMYVGQSGDDFTGVLPTDGDYTIRVYLMRAAARRKESSNYTLTIGVTGKALAPTPASMDALIQGTSFHAAAKITCVPFLETKPQQCEAFVIRRGVDGTATVEIPQANAGKRRILFVQGKPVASDATGPLTVTRKGELSVVTLGSDERYEIPDVLVIGD